MKQERRTHFSKVRFPSRPRNLAVFSSTFGLGAGSITGGGGGTGGGTSATAGTSVLALGSVGVTSAGGAEIRAFI